MDCDNVTHMIPILHECVQLLKFVSGSNERRPSVGQNCRYKTPLGDKTQGRNLEQGKDKRSVYRKNNWLSLASKATITKIPSDARKYTRSLLCFSLAGCKRFGMVVSP